MLRHATLFLLVSASSAVADPSPTIRGRLIDAVTGEPVAGATIYAAEAEVVSAPDGTFALPATGAAAVTVVDAGHEVAVVEIGSGELVIALVPASGEVIEIRGERTLDTPGAVRVDRTQLQVIPGARGDLLSGVKNLPGIANNGSLTPLSSGLIIRGSSPEDSRILIDGFEVPVLYHFLGVQSVLPTEMLANLEYLPGGYGVGFGRAAGGIVAASSRDEPEREGGFAELSFINVAGLIQGRLGKRASYAVAARRSLVDAILPAVLPAESGLAFTVYPRYYDYQGKLSYRPRDGWTLSAFVFGSDDKLELLSDADNGADPVASGQISNATSFTRAITSARYRRPGLQIIAAASAYTDTNHFEVGSERFLRLDRDGIAARGEATWEVNKRVRTTVGAEADVTRTGYDIKFVRPPREGDPRGPNFTDDALIVTAGANTFRDLATWMATSVFPVPELELTGGARVDAYLRNHATVVQPRGEAIWRVADGSVLRAAGGLYTRPPEYLDQGLQPELDPVRTLQTSVGAEQRLAPWLTASGTAFYHRMSDLIVLPSDRRDPASLGGYQNLGRGDARGLELLLKVTAPTTFGWLAYTNARATRRDGDTMPERRFDYDQTHNLIAVASWQASPRWRFGGRFQLTTGKPFTPVVGSTYQADVDLYLPVYGAPASQRVDVQHQLDLRVDRIWKFRTWTLSAYLDVSNAYLNAAAIDYQYNFDYSRRTAITTLPILPAFGVRGEL